MTSQTHTPESKPPESKPPETGKPQPQPPVYTPQHPEYPKAVYNQTTRQTKAATSKDDETKLAQQGFGEQPLPAVNPLLPTPAEIEEFQELLAKIAKYVATLPTQPAQQPAASPKPNGPTKQNDQQQQHHHG